MMQTVLLWWFETAITQIVLGMEFLRTILDTWVSIREQLNKVDLTLNETHLLLFRCSSNIAHSYRGDLFMVTLSGITGMRKCFCLSLDLLKVSSWCCLREFFLQHSYIQHPHQGQTDKAINAFFQFLFYFFKGALWQCPFLKVVYK